MFLMQVVVVRFTVHGALFIYAPDRLVAAQSKQHTYLLKPFHFCLIKDVFSGFLRLYFLLAHTVAKTMSDGNSSSSRRTV